MSMPSKHQLLIEERTRECHNDNSLLVLMYSVLCKVHEHAFIFQKKKKKKRKGRELDDIIIAY